MSGLVNQVWTEPEFHKQSDSRGCRQSGLVINCISFPLTGVGCDHSCDRTGSLARGMSAVRSRSSGETHDLVVRAKLIVSQSGRASQYCSPGGPRSLEIRASPAFSLFERAPQSCNSGETRSPAVRASPAVSLFGRAPQSRNSGETRSPAVQGRLRDYGNFHCLQNPLQSFQISKVV